MPNTDPQDNLVNSCDRLQVNGPKDFHDIRTQNSGSKTILTIKDQKIIILLKGKDQNNYKEWKEPITEAEVTET